MTYRQLLDAEVETIQPQINGWQKVSAKLDKTRHRADDVGKGIRSGDWKGASERAADVKSGFLGQQVTAAKTETDSIKWILWRAQRMFGDMRTLLRDIDKRVKQHPYLEVGDDGRVFVEFGGGSVGIGTDGTSIEVLQHQANQYNESIKKILKVTTTMDADIAGALRAASHVGNPSDPNFNAGAPREGNVRLEKYMDDLYALKFHYPEWSVREYPKSNGERTPQELAAMLNMPHKLGEIQNAHDVATKYGQAAGGFHNGRGDALKHALMSAMLTRDVGEGNARSLMDGHERMPGNPRGEEVMDRHNNEIGYRIARDNPKASDEELARLITNEVNGGRTLSVDNRTGRIEYTDGVPPQD